MHRLMGVVLGAYVTGCMGELTVPPAAELPEQFVHRPETGETPSPAKPLAHRSLLPPRWRPPVAPPNTLEVEVTFSTNQFSFLAVAADGAAYAVRPQERSRLFRSEDHARTWTEVGQFPGARFRVMSALSDGVLLANLFTDTRDLLARSDDRGQSWIEVLPLGSYRMLQPRNIVELNGTVYFSEYQSRTLVADIHVYASTDRGLTWKVRHTFTGRRHTHGMVADPRAQRLWILLGDERGGIFYSEDGGRSWTEVLPEVAPVDAVVTEEGLMFGLDTLYKPYPAGVARMKMDGSWQVVSPLPGPAYSILQLGGGGFLVGETREPGGDIYAPEDFSAHLFGSADGLDFQPLLSFPRLYPEGYARADTYWQLGSGEVVLQLENVEAMGPQGDGYLLLRPRLSTR